jgi:predicted glycosyltransferase
MRYLLYSHDALGLGHVRRNLAVAGALVASDAEASVLIATGSEHVHELGVPPRVDVLGLPALRKLGNQQYAARRLALSGREIRDLRAAVLRAAVQAYRPQVLLADKHPLGARGELRDALHAVRAQGGRAALGVRDILDEGATVRADWASDVSLDTMESLYDRILIYGQSAIFDPVREYRMPPALAERTRFCGYVTPGQRGHVGITAAPRRRGDRPVVLATPGGGEDGLVMLEAFVLAAQRADWDAVLVSGPQADKSDCDTLQAMADRARIRVYGFVRDLSAWFPAVDALVTMGGYNTLVEALAAGTPTVCVPRVKPRQEQLIRARAFAHLGLVSVIDPSCLSPTVLGEEVTAALRSCRSTMGQRVRDVIDLNGARNAAAHLAELAHTAGPVAEAGHAPSQA